MGNQRRGTRCWSPRHRDRCKGQGRQRKARRRIDLDQAFDARGARAWLGAIVGRGGFQHGCDGCLYRDLAWEYHVPTSSRATEEGDEGPLGPEWSMSLTSTESLVEIVNGSLLMTTSNGSQTIFAKPLAGVKCESKAPFESPPGNNNLTLWCEENKETKKRIAYYLENAPAHTKVKFTEPTEGGRSFGYPLSRKALWRLIL